MRWKSMLAAVAIAVGGLAIAGPAEALDLSRTRPPEGWGTVRPIHHYAYYPRYQHIYHVNYRSDPYAYRFEPRGYYPYYNSHHWRPAEEMRQRQTFPLPPYYKAWGYPRKWEHREWHNQNHGRHHHHHW